LEKICLPSPLILNTHPAPFHVMASREDCNEHPYGGSPALMTANRHLAE
jgi:hypothetical protein